MGKARHDADDAAAHSSSSPRHLNSKRGRGVLIAATKRHEKARTRRDEEDQCCGRRLRSSRLARLLAMLDPRRRLTARLCWATFLVICIYVVIVVVVVSTTAYKLVKEATGDQYAQLAFQTSASLDRVMFERWREAQNIATLQQVYDNRGDGSLLDTLRASYPNPIQSNYPTYAWMGITDTKGKVVASTGSVLAGVDVSARDWWRETNLTRAPFVGDLHDARLLGNILPKLPNGDPQRFVDVACPLFAPAVPASCVNVTDPDGTVWANCSAAQAARYTGVVGYHLSWTWAEIVREEALSSSAVDRGVELLILDRTGTLILGPEALIKAGTMFRTGSVARAQGGETGARVETHPDGEFLTGFSPTRGYSTYPGLGWITLVRQRASVANRPADYLLATILIVVLVLSGVLLVVVGLVLRSAIAPLVSIAHAADGVSSQLSHTPYASSLHAIQAQLPRHASRKDEIGQLSYSLDALLALLHAHRLELAGHNAVLESTVERRTAELEAANRELEMFSQTVSHDLRAPLGSIATATQLLQADIAAAAAAANCSADDSGSSAAESSLAALGDEYTTQILADVGRMSSLIQDLLELSRINHTQLRLRHVDLALMARQVLADLQRAEPDRVACVALLLPPVATEAQMAAARRRAKSDCDPEADLSAPAPAFPPAPPSPFVVVCDEGLARVILTNLLSNAWKYSSKREQAVIEFGCSVPGGASAAGAAGGAPDPRDRLQAPSPSLRALGGATAHTRPPVFFVRDNGAGFDSVANAAQLFKPFQRMHSDAEFRGVGVGLSTVARCCQRHGGKIWAHSRVNEGSTFLFTLQRDGHEALQADRLGSHLSHTGAGTATAAAAFETSSSGSGSGSSSVAPMLQIELPPLLVDARAEPVPLLASATPLASPSVEMTRTRTHPVLPPTLASPSAKLLRVENAPLHRRGSSAGGGGGPTPLIVEENEEEEEEDGGRAGSTGDHQWLGADFLPSVRFHEELPLEIVIPQDEEAKRRPAGDSGGVTPAEAAAPPHAGADAGAPQSAWAAVSSASVTATVQPSTPLSVSHNSSDAPSQTGSAAQTAAPTRRPGTRPRPSVSASSECDPALRGLRVLFCDDSALNRKLCGRMLTAQGLLVETAGDGVEVLQRIYPDRPASAVAAHADGDGAAAAVGAAAFPTESSTASPLPSKSAISVGAGGGLGGGAHGGGHSRSRSRPDNSLIPARRPAHCRVQSMGDASSLLGLHAAAVLGDAAQSTASPSHALLGRDSDNSPLSPLSPHAAGADMSTVAATLDAPPCTDLAVGVTAPSTANASVALPFDLVILDLNMDGMDGLTCAVRLREFGYGGALVALTAHTEGEKKAECMSAGFDAFLSKPFDARQLRDTIAKSIAARANGSKQQR